MAILVIKRWEAEAKPFDDRGTRILIEGRAGGLLSWLLHLVQIEPVTQLRVTAERAELERSSLSGKEHVFVPLEHVCHCAYGYHKPWKKALAVLVVTWWILSLLFPLLAALISRDPRGLSSSSALLGTVLAGIFGLAAAVAYYLLSKSFLLSMVTYSGAVYALCFKRSIIENRKIDAHEAAFVAEMLDYLCDERRRALV